jgi:hypothetical protein
MKNSTLRSRRCKALKRRVELLGAYDRSGLSAAAFARQHNINYTTFCGWRQRRDKSRNSPAFVEIEVPVASAPVELVLELGVARLRLHSNSQIELAVRLLQALNTPQPC